MRRGFRVLRIYQIARARGSSLQRSVNEYVKQKKKFNIN